MTLPGLGLSWAQQEKLIIREVQTLSAVRGCRQSMDHLLLFIHFLVVQLVECYEDDEFIHLVFELYGTPFPLFV